MPADITGDELDKQLRGELRTLTKEQMERVSRHLVACGIAREQGETHRALEHAKWAARFGARVAAVRDIYGSLLYDSGDYKGALRELRAAMRISGHVDMLPVIADAERGMGRPEKALEIAQMPQARRLSDTDTIELMIVVAGAYADMGDLETALASLEIPALRHKVDGKWQLRLWLAYADLLDAAGRGEEALKWVRLAADADVHGQTDAAQRLGREPKHVDEPVMGSDEQIGVFDVYEDFVAQEEAAMRQAEDTTDQQAQDEVEELMNSNTASLDAGHQLDAEASEIIGELEDASSDLTDPDLDDEEFHESDDVLDEGIEPASQYEDEQHDAEAIDGAFFSPGEDTQSDGLSAQEQR